MVETSIPNSTQTYTPTNSTNFFGAMLLNDSSFKMRGVGSCKPRPSVGASSSLFTIDSILAPRPSVSGQQIRHQSSPVLHHPIHLGHIAAATGFGAHSDFLGKGVFRKVVSIGFLYIV